MSKQCTEQQGSFKRLDRCTMRMGILVQLVVRCRMLVTTNYGCILTYVTYITTVVCLRLYVTAVYHQLVPLRSLRFHMGCSRKDIKFMSTDRMNK